MTEQALSQRPPLDRNRSSSSIHATNTHASATDRDTSSNDEQQQQAHHPSRPHKPKQFVVGGSRHHSRVPSYGRNLNKLGKLAPLATSPGKAVRGTAAGGATASQTTAGLDDRPRPSAKKPTFELGSDGSYKDSANFPSNGNGSGSGNAAVGGTTGAAATTGAPATKSSNGNGLVKSSSTRSLDRQSRDVARKSVSKRTALDGKRDRSRSKSREGRLTHAHRTHHKSSEALADIAESLYSLPQGHEHQKQQQQQQQRQQQQGQQQQNQRLDQQAIPYHHLVPQTDIKGPSLPPRKSIEAVTTNTMQNLTPNSHHHPVTPAHSLPGSHDQPLTSRFIESPANASNSISPSSGTTSYPHPAPQRSKSATSLPTTTTAVAPAHEQPQQPPPPSITPPTSTTTTIPSRTQQKLWLQRASSQHESPPHNGVSSGSRFGPGSEWYLFQSRAQKEFERISREYMNIRRFNDPIGEGIERIRDVYNTRRIPRRTGTPNESGAGTLGLSQSLNEMGSRGVREVRVKGSKDDSGVKQSGIVERDREGEVDTILAKMWSAGEMLPSNE